MKNKIENHEITSAAKYMSKAFQNKKFCEKTSKLLQEIFDGKSVNKNPLSELPNPEMRLYYVDDNYFESIDEFLNYCKKNNISKKRLKTLDYYRKFAGCNDVIRNYDGRFFTVVNEDGYGIYNDKRSIYCGEFIWEYNNGSIREMYKPFRDKGVVFEDDFYAKQDEKMQLILKQCRDIYTKKK